MLTASPPFGTLPSLEKPEKAGEKTTMHGEEPHLRRLRRADPFAEKVTFSPTGKRARHWCQGSRASYGVGVMQRPVGRPQALFGLNIERLSYVKKKCFWKSMFQSCLPMEARGNGLPSSKDKQRPPPLPLDEEKRRRSRVRSTFTSLTQAFPSNSRSR